RGRLRVTREERDVIQVVLDVGRRFDERDANPAAGVEDLGRAIRQLRAGRREDGYTQRNMPEGARLARPLCIEERQLPAARIRAQEREVVLVRDTVHSEMLLEERGDRLAVGDPERHMIEGLRLHGARHHIDANTRAGTSIAPDSRSSRSPGDRRGTSRRCCGGPPCACRTVTWLRTCASRPSEPSTALRSSAWRCSVSLCCALRCCALQYCALRCSAWQCCALRYSASWRCPASRRCASWRCPASQQCASWRCPAWRCSSWRSSAWRCCASQQCASWRCPASRTCASWRCPASQQCASWRSSASRCSASRTCASSRCPASRCSASLSTASPTTASPRSASWRRTSLP